MNRCECGQYPDVCARYGHRGASGSFFGHEEMLEEIDITLTRSDLIALARMVRQKNRKAARQAMKSTWQPEPGRSDRRIHTINRGLDLLTRLEEAIGHGWSAEEPHQPHAED